MPGHHSDGSSIQQHSAGTQYPFVVQVIENYLGAEGLGKVEVIDPTGLVWFSLTYLHMIRDARLQAYACAYNEADRLAFDRRNRTT